MKPYKITYADEEGQKEERGFRSGITRVALGEVTPCYEENVLKPIRDQFKKEEKDIKHKARIQEKLKEMAEKELEKEGNLAKSLKKLERKKG